ncbi:MAG: hypothetical protein Q3979_09595 [Actinomycetaceae bacterium]|nr:hypothetical protein [Actinomycetaceae bacterium]
MKTAVFGASIVAASSNNSSGSGGAGISSLLLVVVLAALAFPLIRWFVRRARIARLENWATSQGFDFWRTDRKLGKQIGKLLFMHGHGHCAKYVVVMPSRNGTCLYGQIEWKEGRGNKEVTLTGAFVQYALKAPLPFLLVTPRYDEGGLMPHKIKGITTEWDDFNRQWQVESADRQYALAMLSPVMQAFIMDNLHDVMLRIDGPYGYIRTAEYAIEESVEYRALMDDWEDRVVPFLWQDAHLG